MRLTVAVKRAIAVKKELDQSLVASQPCRVPVRCNLEVVSILERLGYSTGQEYSKTTIVMHFLRKKRWKTASWSGTAVAGTPWCSSNVRSDEKTILFFLFFQKICD
jgi:hypothetical protein